MPRLELTITVNCEWFKEDADLTECSVCGDIMVANTNVYYAFVGNYDPQPLLKTCNSCFNAIEDANNN